MNASVEGLSTNSIKHRPCFTSRQMKESSSRGLIKGLHRILDPYKNVEGASGLK